MIVSAASEAQKSSLQKALALVKNAVADLLDHTVITSYSIHYTKLYDDSSRSFVGYWTCPNRGFQWVESSSVPSAKGDCRDIVAWAALSGRLFRARSRFALWFLKRFPEFSAVYTVWANSRMRRISALFARKRSRHIITSYSIHYTKLYDNILCDRGNYYVIDWMTTNRGNPLVEVSMMNFLLHDAELFPGSYNFV